MVNSIGEGHRKEEEWDYWSSQHGPLGFSIDIKENPIDRERDGSQGFWLVLRNAKEGICHSSSILI